MNAVAIGLEPVADVAARNGVTTRCMKRRLRRMADRLRVAYPAESPLLVQFGGGRYFLDRSVAWRHARGLIVEGGQDPWEALHRAVSEMRDELAASIASMREAVDAVQADTTLLRDYMAAAR